MSSNQTIWLCHDAENLKARIMNERLERGDGEFRGSKKILYIRFELINVQHSIQMIHFVLKHDGEKSLYVKLDTTRMSRERHHAI